MEKKGIEIERKYIIEMPEISVMEKMEGYTRSEIRQIYLKAQNGKTHRIRSRSTSGITTYTETTKERIDFVSALEEEREITLSEFDRLRELRDGKTKEIIKTRHTFIYRRQLFEIDVYPEWKRTAILETELLSKDEKIEMPRLIRIVTEVTGDSRYSNASMSRNFPKEVI